MRAATLTALLAACSAPAPKPPAPAPDTAVDSGPAPDPSEDPLSMPSTPTVDLGDFAGARSCGDCHPTHLAEWSRSVHAHAVRDPLLQALVDVRRAAPDTGPEAFCLQCHSAPGVRGGDVIDGFRWDALAPITLEGVTCEACHKVQEVLRDHNAGHLLDPSGPMRGPLSDPTPTGAHSSREAPWMREARFCGSCHDVRERSGLPLERPYGEWLSSPAAAEGRPCGACHMPARIGRAAAGGPEREIHDHRFIGVDVPDGLSTEDAADVRAGVEALLAGAARLDLRLPANAAAGGRLDLVLTATSQVDGHDLPTGSTFNRQLWVELTVDDAAGRRLYASGTLDSAGDLRDAWSDEAPFGDADLWSFSSELVDAHGQRTRLSHEAVEHRSRALQPLQARTVTRFVEVPADATGPLTVRARLRFRAAGPHLYRLAGLPVPALPITDIDVVEGVVTLR